MEEYRHQRQGVLRSDIEAPYHLGLQFQRQPCGSEESGSAQKGYDSQQEAQFLAALSAADCNFGLTLVLFWSHLKGKF